MIATIETIAAGEPDPNGEPKQRPYMVLGQATTDDVWIELGIGNGRTEPEAKDDVVSVWIELGIGNGRTEPEAKDDVVSKLPIEEQQDRMFVAIPMRSWKPKKRTIETTVKPRWS